MLQKNHFQNGLVLQESKLEITMVVSHVHVQIIVNLSLEYSPFVVNLTYFASGH